MFYFEFFSLVEGEREKVMRIRTRTKRHRIITRTINFICYFTCFHSPEDVMVDVVKARKKKQKIRKLSCWFLL